MYREDDVLAAEEARLKLEEEIADMGGSRFVTTQHFTVNCELEAFTRELFHVQYGQRFSEAEVSEYVAMRTRRRQLYLSGKYRSEEVINGPSYIDFFYGKGLFEQVTKSTRKEQLEEVLTTAGLQHVMRRVYSRATPELPTVLSYSHGRSIIRVEDLTMLFTDGDAEEATRVLRGYADRADFSSPESVRAFLSNPLNPQR